MDGRLSISQYVRTTWTGIGILGLPPVEALAQTADGYLWLGTADGLLRFDGLRFASWDELHRPGLPANRVTALYPSARGGLWIATTGGVSRFDRSGLATFTTRDGLPRGTFASLLEDREGRLWIGAIGYGAGGLAVIPQGARSAQLQDKGLPDRAVLSLRQDARGRLWVGTHRGLCQWSAAGKADCAFAPAGEIVAIQETAAGGLLLLDGAGQRILTLDGAGRTAVGTALRERNLQARAMLLDRHGNLWIGTLGQGLLRVRGGRVERFTRRDGLSGDVVHALLEDREGNLWVGTASGLDRFREPKVARLTTLQGLSGNLCTAVCASRNGGVWVGTAGGGLDYVANGSTRRYSTESGLPSATVLSIHEDSSRRLWVGTTGGLVRSSRGRFVEVAAADGSRLNRVFDIAGGGAAIWFADARRGIFRLNGRTGLAEPVPRFPGRDVYTIYADRAGGLWIGFYQGGLTIVRDGAERHYAPGQGLAPGPVQSIFEDQNGNIWAGTARGLSRLRNGSWTTWSGEQGLPRSGVQGIQETPGRLWLVTAAGLLSLDSAALDATPAGRPGPLSFTVAGPGDGVRFPQLRRMENPRISKSADGRLWASTDDGVAVVDAAYSPRNTFPPPVVIDTLVVDGAKYDPAAPNLAFRAHKIEVQFSVLTLGIPEAARFRYTLEGFDSKWTDGAGARQIVYANLPPGRYRFRVTGANEDGVWNSAGASIAFYCRPAFYQTWAFLALCVCVPLLAGGSFHWLRVRSLQSRFRLVLEERSRLARELHDTLLQGFAGVVYQLEAVSHHIDGAPEASRQRLARAVEQADQSLKEARHALSSLRLPALEDKTLAQALSEAGQQIVSGAAIRFDMDVQGLTRELPYDVQANLYAIAREAITNARNHAGPKQIRLRVVYSAREVRMSIQDDGVGFDPAIANAAKNHWGMAGMRERAAQIGADLQVTSAPGRGTTVNLVVVPQDLSAQPRGRAKMPKG